MSASSDPEAGFGIAGQVAIVTGAASGIGRATAIRLAAHGARVTAVDIDGGRLAGLEGCVTATADLSRPEACEHVVDTVLARGAGSTSSSTPPRSCAASRYRRSIRNCGTR